MIYENLVIINWPDPRLKKLSVPVERFDERLKILAARMLELMHQAKGVGLAAPQVGLNIRLFVMNPTGQPQDDRVYVNPVLSEGEGDEEGEEGCLSLPGIYIPVSRFRTVHMQAMDIEGNAIDQVESGYLSRIWQHETDHLNGTLLTDRMGAMAKLTHRKKLKELEEAYRAANPAPAKTVKLTPKRLARK